MPSERKLSALAASALVVAAVLVPALALLPTASATLVGGNTGIESCIIVDEPGRYDLTADVTPSLTSGQSCVEITSSNVVLDGHNNTLTLPGTGTAVAVTNAGSITNVTVRNVSVRGAERGFAVGASGEEAQVGVSLVGNRVNESAEAVDLDANGLRSTVDVQVSGNEFTYLSGDAVDVSADGDGASGTIRVTDNVIANASADGIDVDVDGDSSNFDIAVSGNAVFTGGNAIDNVQADGTGSETNVTIAANLLFSAENEGIDLLDARSEDGTVAVTVSGNVIEAGANGIDEILADESGTTVRVTVRENMINATTDGIHNVSGSGPNQIFDAEVTGNVIQAGDQGIEDIRVHGPNSTASVAVRGNRIESADEGIDEIDGTGFRNDLSVSVLNNEITSGSWGIDYIEGYADNQTVDIEIANNNITGPDAAIYEIDVAGTHTTARVSLVDNTLTSGDGYGIEYLEGDADDQTLDFDVVRNDIDAYYEPIYQIDSTGERTKADVDVVDNRLASSDDSGIEDLWIADENHQQASLAFVGNTVVSADDDTIDDIDADGFNTTVDIALVNNSFTAKTDMVFDSLEADDDNQTVAVLIANNDFTTNGNGLEDIYVYGDNATVDLAIVDNDFDTNATGIYGIEADGNDASVDVRILGNTMAVQDSGIEDFELGASDQSVQSFVVGNRITGFTNFGIEVDKLGLLDSDEFEMLVRANRLASDAPSGSVGLLIDPSTGTGPPGGTFLAEHNYLAADSAVRVQSGPVAGIRLTDNHLAGITYGVENLNTTAGTVVDARGNFWGAADGPAGQEGSLEEPMTGRLANGTGAGVSGANATLANVRFAPFLHDEPAPRLSVALASTTAPVTEGDSLIATAKVENLDAGANASTRTVELVVDGERRDSASVTLLPGVSRTVSLTWGTSSGDAGEHTVRVTDGNGSDSTGVTVAAANDSGGESVDVSADDEVATESGETDETEDSTEEEQTEEESEEETEEESESDEGRTSSGTASTVVTREEDSSETQVEVSDAESGQPTTVEMPEESSVGDASVESISVVPEVDGDFSMSVQQSPEPLDTSPEFQASDGTTPLGYMSVDHSIPNEEISEATITYRVSEERVEALDSNPEAVSLYRHDGTEWVEQPTEFVGRENGELILQTTASGLSEWTAAAKRPRLNVTGTDVSVQAATTDEEVTIQVFVRNTGGTDGVYEAELLLNEETVDRTERTVPDGGTVAVNFERTFGQPGLYEVQVNDVFVGEVNISAAEESVEVDTEGAGTVRANGTDDPAEPGGVGGGSLPVLPIGVALVLVAGLGVWVYLTRAGE